MGVPVGVMKPGDHLLGDLIPFPVVKHLGGLRHGEATDNFAANELLW